MSGIPSADAGSGPIIDVSEADFDVQVIQASHTKPVVVDFWADWCAPCKMLGPTLERLAREADGAWTLAKVNTDFNQGLSARYGVQGIPAVKAFRNGKVVSEFVGAQPEPSVRQFLQDLAPSEADALCEQAHGEELAGELERSAKLYRSALDSDQGHAGALLGLGRVLVAGDLYEEAVVVLERVPLGSAERGEAETWLATAKFRRDSELTGGEIEARRRLAADPSDLEARLALAAALAAKGAHRESLEGLFEVLERDDGEYRQRARSTILDIFKLLGDDNELTIEYRARLATVLW